ncbi:MAG: hypothetical protein Kow0047_34060 [Anaerolineae bacterium]
MAESEERTTEAQTPTATESEEQPRTQSSAPQRRPRGPRRFGGRRRVCAMCTEGVNYIDYKQKDLLMSYISERGQIRPRRKTGLCAKHQRRLAVAVKRARHLALLPFTGEHVRLARLRHSRD